MSERFVFLDRDGTLIHDPGYVHRIEDYRLLDGVVDALLLLQDADFRLAIVTNQSGIGRGLFSEQDFQRFEAHLVLDLADQGVEIEQTFHCPHTPEDDCECRKPGTLLLVRARDELDADLSESWVVGDRESDVELAQNAGCRSVLISSERGVPDLLAAAELILDESE